MTLEQIKRLVQVYITEELEEREVGRMGHKNGGDDAERDTIALVITSSLDDTAEQLQRNDYRRISKDVDELLQRHRRTLSKSSEAYHRLCRELLKAKQYVLKKELDRQDGLYFADFASPGGIGDGATVVMESSRLISDVLPEYFKTYDNRRERTNKGKARRLERFIECVGDKPLAEVTKTDCKLF
ncbi:MAG: hypothetical protein E8D40_00900 [Nitrospira sp.]|nr:MAG: hypothetical protein E8D40_00900 [Nitrospira sp.]